MLKPVDPTTPGIGDEPSIGGLIHQLVEDGKAYAQAELTFAKAVGSAKAGAMAKPVALIAASVLFIQAGLTALAVGIGIGLAHFVGPVLGGLIAFLLFGAVAGGMVMIGVKQLRSPA